MKSIFNLTIKPLWKTLWKMLKTMAKSTQFGGFSLLKTRFNVKI